MSKHTPGEWKYKFDEDGGYDAISAGYEITAENDQIIADVDVIDYLDIEWCKWSDAYDIRHSRHEMAEANARLIAAAPELLEALEDALSTIDFERHKFRPWQAKARQAIAKAKGETR